MASSAEVSSPLTIPQPDSPLNIDFVVPAQFVDRFMNVTQIASNEKAPLPHVVAAIVAEDHPTDISDEDLAERVYDLGVADQYLRENAGTAFMHASRTGIEAGITNGNHGLTTID